ncbi:hypothetical protein BZM27_43085 [Paraburkholderia steynii]|uniref:Uncharacterized protein n=1 Tax=Paraburkholderia steynii TaxID=1245441 RepID=A0A4R0X2S3_9BURK|nr:hypothetical protein BZM27_43085 [Paraburkholderia steynii]
MRIGNAGGNAPGNGRSGGHQHGQQGGAVSLPITCLAAKRVPHRHVTVIAMNHASISIAPACAINTKRRPAKHGLAHRA